MNDLRQLALEILRDGFILNLGTYDGDGPWVTSLIYVNELFGYQRKRVL